MAIITHETDIYIKATINGVDCEIKFNNSMLGFPDISMKWKDITGLNETRIALEKITKKKVKS